MTVLRVFATAASVLCLAACGGGGGGGGLNATPSSPAPAPTPTPTPVNFDTAEFRFSEGLGEINAIPAYDAGLSGEGSIVAIIDSGVDPTHPDLDGNLHPASQDVVFGRTQNTGLVGLNSHGTAVAGIAAAERNGAGMHGVAFNAQILSLRADAPGDCGDGANCSLFDSDIARGVDIAVAQGADVINLSLGGSSPSSTLRVALANAADAGVVIVISAGNSGEANPTDFALAGLTPALFGKTIVVGSNGRDLDIVDESARAGVAQEIYLLAPSSVATTGLGGGYVIAAGTSFAAPHVAGAVAVLAELFPNLSSEEIVSILLDTATDLGASGTDAIYGRGLLNLGAAVAPQGTQSAVTGVAADGAPQTTPLEGAQILAGAAFGDAFTAGGAFQGLATLDSYDRHFAADVTNRIRNAATADALVSEALYARTIETGASSFSLAPGASANVSFWRDIPHGLPLSSYADEISSSVDGMSFTFATALTKNTHLSFTSGDGRLTERAQNRAGALTGAGRNASFADFGEGAGRAVSVDHTLAKGLSASLTLVSRTYEASTLAPGTEAGMRAAKFDVSGETGPLRVNGALGMMSERGALLGAIGEGAFDLGPGADTYFVSGGVEASLPFGWSAFANAETGRTRAVAPDDAVIKSFSTLSSFGFAAAVKRANAWRRGDVFALSVSQPLRIEDGALRLTDLQYVDDGWREITRDGRLAPTGRQIDVELSYTAPLSDRVSVSAHLLAQQDPGHSALGDDDRAVVVTLFNRF
ncbi:MAG: S8 family peptidase [Pseudomonadota bacterium]